DPCFGDNRPVAVVLTSETPQPSDGGGYTPDFGAMQHKYCAAQSSADRTSLFPVRRLEARQPSAFRRGRVFCRLARALAEFPRLLGQRLHLALDIVGLQSQHVLDVSRPHQLLGKFEGARDVLLGESHRLFGYILGTLAGEACDLLKYQRPNRPPAPART